MAQARQYSAVGARAVPRPQEPVSLPDWTWSSTALRRFGCALAALVLSGAAQAQVAMQPLQVMHEKAFERARQELAMARQPEAVLSATYREVQALNSLGQSARALARLDEAESALPPEQRDAGLRVKVSLALGRCDEALPALQSRIESRDRAAATLMGAAYRPGGYLVMAAEDLLALAYCHTANRRFNPAVAALRRVIDPFDPSLLHYTAAWYTSLRSLGAEENPDFESAVRSLPVRGGAHAVSLSVVKAEIDLEQARRELNRIRLDAAALQDAWAEVLFFHAVIAQTPALRAETLARLEALAPFGSTEWVLSRLLFAPR